MPEEVQDGDAVAFMSRHFVALTCHYDLRKADDTTERQVLAFSGFVLELHGAYFWVTAGHCLKQFDKLLSFPEVHVCGGGFMESCLLHICDLSNSSNSMVRLPGPRLRDALL